MMADEVGCLTLRLRGGNTVIYHSVTAYQAWERQCLYHGPAITRATFAPATLPCWCRDGVTIADNQRS